MENQMMYSDGTLVTDPIDMDRPIKIYCRKHGEFNVKPVDHLNGTGCPTCESEDEINMETSTLKRMDHFLFWESFDELNRAIDQLTLQEREYYVKLRGQYYGDGTYVLRGRNFYFSN